MYGLEAMADVNELTAFIARGRTPRDRRGVGRGGRTPARGSSPRFVAGLTLDAIPAEVVSQARRSLLDTFGCGLFGATLPWSAILRTTLGQVDDGRRAGSGEPASGSAPRTRPWPTAPR